MVLSGEHSESLRHRAARAAALLRAASARPGPAYSAVADGSPQPAELVPRQPKGAETSTAPSIAARIAICDACEHQVLREHDSRACRLIANGRPCAWRNAAACPEGRW